MPQVKQVATVKVRYDLRCGYVRCGQVASQLVTAMTNASGFCNAEDVTDGFDSAAGVAVLEVEYASLEDALQLNAKVLQFVSRCNTGRKQFRFCVGRNDQRSVQGSYRRRWFATESEAEKYLETLPEADVSAGLYYLEKR